MCVRRQKLGSDSNSFVSLRFKINYFRFNYIFVYISKNSLTAPYFLYIDESKNLFHFIPCRIFYRIINLSM